MGGTGGQSASGRRPKGNMDTKLYTLLGVAKDASTAEIKTAYRKMALQYHPDKPGGDAEKFKELTRAFEVLSDPDKRRVYDLEGEEGLKDNRRTDPVDPFSHIFGPGTDRPRRRKTKDVVQPLKVSLEQLYNGQMKKMAITRRVIDKTKGVTTCSDCAGRGVRLEVVRMGPMTQHLQSACQTCSGQGKSFKTTQEREVLEVHVQKGSPDGHKVVLREKADEQPDADTGDVIFVLKQSEHPEFKRKGADLFVERKISLVEALCGFELSIKHLDGRQLLVKTQPGELVKPMAWGFDPLAEESGKTEWEVIENADCDSLDCVAEADTTDVDTLKKACETQLKRKGIDVGCFVIANGRTVFKQASREEVLAAKHTKKGATMYVVADPAAKASQRLMKAVKGEGMPTYRNPFVHGNLFLLLTIEFPGSLTPSAQASIRQLLPPPLNTPSFQANDEGVEVHMVTDLDPVESYNSNKVNMQSGSEAYDTEDNEGPQQPQCHQQ